MPYCSSCGIEVDENAATCPLCEAPIQALGGPGPNKGGGPYPQRIIDPENAYKLSKAERRRIGVEILTLIAVLSCGALVLIDMLSRAGWGWSRYAVASIALGWTVSIAPLLLYDRGKAALAVVAAAIVAYILVLDALDGSLSWSLSLGIPIALASYIAIAATASIMASRRVKGLNLLGIGALALAVYLVALETIIRLAIGADASPYWSLVAAIALVTVAILLYYLHGRVLRGANLRKIFRL